MPLNNAQTKTRVTEGKGSRKRKEQDAETPRNFTGEKAQADAAWAIRHWDSECTFGTSSSKSSPNAANQTAKEGDCPQGACG